MKLNNKILNKAIEKQLLKEATDPNKLPWLNSQGHIFLDLLITKLKDAGYVAHLNESGFPKYKKGDIKVNKTERKYEFVLIINGKNDKDITSKDLPIIDSIVQKYFPKSYRKNGQYEWVAYHIVTPEKYMVTEKVDLKKKQLLKEEIHREIYQAPSGEYWDKTTEWERTMMWQLTLHKDYKALAKLLQIPEEVFIADQVTIKLEAQRNLESGNGPQEDPKFAQIFKTAKDKVKKLKKVKSNGK